MLQKRGACLYTLMHWTPLPVEFLMFPWHHCHLCVVVFGASLQLYVPRFCTFSFWYTFISCLSVSICGCTKNDHHLSEGRHSTFLGPRHDLRSPLQGSVGEAFRCFFWVKPSSCAIVVMHRGVYCFLPLRRVATDIYPLFHKHVFQCLASWDPV